MEYNQVVKEVNDIFIDVLDNEDIKLTDSTTATDIDEWDSLSHIQLVVAIEKHFKIKFNTAEIQSWKNVGEMCKAIANRAN